MQLVRRLAHQRPSAGYRRIAASCGLVVVAFIAIGCSEPAPLVQIPTEPPAATAEPTGLAVEPQPTKARNGTGGSYYRPPGWDGVSDVDCADFDTHAHAMSFFRGTGGSKSYDPYRLDSDHDGNACESLP